MSRKKGRKELTWFDLTAYIHNLKSLKNYIFFIYPIFVYYGRGLHRKYIVLQGYKVRVYYYKM